ncbi:SDR family oxidoreductase [Spirosoma montaniterrae]|uniref:Sugar dehydrogenase n=1 Tax=Spirosoma montaniterrae TaxID=1178516 RepID=A0A1P9WT96_9BACT|nr:SDR family oxidoreductase [Spirosoma montaniterrae]AQG78589.1 sugar dehydrogenase [Spirosoma montaniterrae]
MDQTLKGQIALITGASSGIGAGVAKSLAKAGATVVINYPVASSQVAAEAVLQEITDAGGQGMTAQCDVSQEAQVEAMFSDVVSRYGTVDILVNNAGIERNAPFHEQTLDQWNAVINVNLTGQFLCARAAIREFLRRGPRPEVSAATGKIICMSSVHELIPWAGHVNYAASKGGVKLMMQSLAQEYGDRRIRVNSICPGAIQTPINRPAWETPQAMSSLLGLIPYNRIGQPEDIGNLAVFLASDLSDYITGASIFIDGGMTVFESFATGG